MVSFMIADTLIFSTAVDIMDAVLQNTHGTQSHGNYLVLLPSLGDFWTHVSYIPKFWLSNVRIPIHICGNVCFTCIDRFTKFTLHSNEVNGRGTLKYWGLANSLHGI